MAGMFVCSALGQLFPHFFYSPFVFPVHDGGKLPILFSVGKGHDLLSVFSCRA
jgi:hypothetical protein